MRQGCPQPVVDGQRTVGIEPVIAEEDRRARMGALARDVLRALTTQSWTLVAIGLAFGIPLGIALGRVAWQVVAEQIGVRASAPTSPLVLLAVTLLACVSAALLSVPPGVAAVRQRSVDALRAE